MSTANVGDQNLAVYLEAFGTAGEPVVKFATYSTDQTDPIILQLSLEVSEIDG